MDEQISRTTEDSCPNLELKAESSNLSEVESMREHLPSAEQIQPALCQRATGDRGWQHFPDVSSLDRGRVDENVIDDADMKDVTSFQSNVCQGCLQPNGDVGGSGVLPRYVELRNGEQMDPGHQLGASPSLGRAVVDQGEQVQAGVGTPGAQADSKHIDHLQETGASNCVQESVDFVVHEGCHEEASLEMLSVAVESFENMHRQNEEVLNKVSSAVGKPSAKAECAGNDFEHASIDSEKHCSVKSSMTKSTSESDDNGSSVIDGISGPKSEFQGSEHVLNLLCELAALHQQEGELLTIPTEMMSCIKSFADGDAAVGQPKRLSFVNLLRKQMVHAGMFTDLATDAIYEEFLRQNKEFLGNRIGNDLNRLIPSAGMSSNDGGVIALGSEQRSNGTSEREGDIPSMNEIIADSRCGETNEDLGNALENGVSDLKEETSDGETRFGVGDLVWAKIKSHPWWPGQIFDAADASVAAKKIQRPGRTLVAFFGDGTFGWLQQFQLIPFMPNFADKVKQTTMKRFCRAVAGALDEVCRRTELGLRCSHSNEAIYSPNVFPDLNVGIRKGVRLRCHQDIKLSKGKLHPLRVLKFIQTAACSPLYPLSSGLEYSELCGHVYAFRSFLLSPNMPESTLLNMVKAQKQIVKSLQISTLKRRLGLDEPGGAPDTVVRKEAKRLHISEDGLKDLPATSKVQSPRFRSMEVLLSTDADESKKLESEVKSNEQVEGGMWLAKGKRLHISPDSNEKKRAGGWHFLGPLRDPTESGAKTTMDTSASPDDDSKTLFDMTGLYSLKKKKKGTVRSSTDVMSEKGGQQPLEVKQELPDQQAVPDLYETREDEGCLPDSGISSLSTTIPESNPSPMLKDALNVEDKKDAHGPLDWKDADVEINGQLKGELMRLKVSRTEDDGKQEREPIHSEVGNADLDEKGGKDLKAGVRDDYERDQKKLYVGFTEKTNERVLEAADLGKSEKDEGELSANSKESQSLPVVVIDNVRKQAKRLHSEIDNTLTLREKEKKSRKDTQAKEMRSLSPADNKEAVPRKSSKLGSSMRKAAGAPKVTATSPKSVKHAISNKMDVSAFTVKCEVGEVTKSQNSSPTSQVRNVNEEGLGMSLTKLLSTLQLVATDPLSSASLRSSLEGATSVFLRFRNMVFVKSSGYVVATSGKLMPSIANGHFSSDKKVDDKGRSGRKTSLNETRRTGLKDSSVERKALSKIESSFGSVLGPENQKLTDTSDETKAVAIKGHSGASGDQGSNMQRSSAVNETRSSEAPICGEAMTAGKQSPCLQELTIAARKRKSEVLQESATKILGKSEALKGPLEMLSLGKKFSGEKHGSTRLYTKSIKHHISKAESSSSLGKSRSVQSSGNTKVALGLFMRFPEDYTLPSEAELKEVFSQFGMPETFGIRVYKNDSTAQVVFKDKANAEYACKYARENRIFGQANVSYRLRHFSLSSKRDPKLFSLTSVKKGPSETRDSKSSSIENLERSCVGKNSTGSEKRSFLIPSHPPQDLLPIRSYSDTGALRASEQAPEDKDTLIRVESVPAHPPAKDLMISTSDPGSLRVVEQASVSVNRFEPVLADSPASRQQPGSLTSPLPFCASVSASSTGGNADLRGSIRLLHEDQQEVIQSPSPQSDWVTNCLNPPSTPSVNVSSGDIKDQMLKLLQQVSVIVTSTSLTPKTI